jgi:hypothetical protein
MRSPTIPFDEMLQLERKAKVFAILQQDNLSKWARNYWSTVFETISTTKSQYDARVECSRLCDEMKSLKYMSYEDYSNL